VAASAGFFQYLKAAFSARPAGMPLPPNWVLVAAFGLLGAFANPGFLVLGAGIELLYLFVLGTNARFRRLVDAVRASKATAGSVRKVETMVAALSPESRHRFQDLRGTCDSVIETLREGAVDPQLIEQHTRSLDGFGWVFLQLLATRDSAMELVQEARLSERFRQKLELDKATLERRIAGPGINGELKQSLEGQLDIVNRRLQVLEDVGERLQVIEAELKRVEQHVELLREQAVLSKDAQPLSQRIDSMGATLGETTQWINEQQRLLGLGAQLTEDPPAIVSRRAVAEGE
jgi:hypothetical protein